MIDVKQFRARVLWCLHWLVFLLLITACGGGTTTGANTAARGVPQDEEEEELLPMPQDGADEGGQNAGGDGGQPEVN